jgi:hypothetical protein
MIYITLEVSVDEFNRVQDGSDNLFIHAPLVIFSFFF